jgi:hypothetical protein
LCGLEGGVEVLEKEFKILLNLASRGSAHKHARLAISRARRATVRCSRSLAALHRARRIEQNGQP